MLIIVALSITLANLKQVIHYKILCLKIVGIYKKYCEAFGLAIYFGPKYILENI